MSHLPPLSSVEPYNRSHELDEELDEAFLEFLRARGVTIIGCSANNAARTTIVKWVDPAGRAKRIDVSDFPAWVVLVTPSFAERTGLDIDPRAADDDFSY